MGLYVGRARFADTGARRALLVIRGLVAAWLFHGLYDTFAMSGSGLVLLVLPVLAGLCAFGIISLRTGRRLSLRRWRDRTALYALSGGPGAAQDAAAAPDAAPPEPAAPRPVRRAPRWMPVVSRFLLAAAGLVWLLLILGIATDTEGGAGYIALGGIVLTIIPLSMGVLLEVLYHRWKRAHAAAAAA
jgi:hypothetical protein